MNSADDPSGGTALVLGASGATGRLLVEELLARAWRVRTVVRRPESLPAAWAGDDNLTVVHASVLELSDDELAALVKDCSAVASCLGHNLTLRGVYGEPRRLVTDAVRRVCAAARANAAPEPLKFVLMNTAGNRNRGSDEQVSFAESCVVGLLRVLVPPHADNEDAAEFLRARIGSDDRRVEWAVVRPDGLTDEDRVTRYELHASPVRSAIFDAGRSSRRNVASFMADLIADATVWDAWKGRMPVLYNADES